MIFVGIDWAEAHHDVCVLDREGEMLASRRIPEGLEGVARLHALLADHVEEPIDVVVGIETDRGLLVDALVAAGYTVHAVNPLAASRYRERHTTSRAKSDRGDARVLAELVRTDRHHHRTVATDSELAGAIKLLARSHQNLIWTRGRQRNALRSALREYYPGALAAFEELAHPDALAVLRAAPDPERGRRLSTARIVSLLRKGGRRRNLEQRATAIRDALQAPQLEAPPLVAEAQAANTTALVAVITTLNEQIDRLEAELTDAFGRHPDAELFRSLPGLGDILGARVLARCLTSPSSAHRRSFGSWGTASMTPPHSRPRRCSRSWSRRWQLRSMRMGPWQSSRTSRGWVPRMSRST
jgi:transposase